MKTKLFTRICLSGIFILFFTHLHAASIASEYPPTYEHLFAQPLIKQMSTHQAAHLEHTASFANTPIPNSGLPQSQSVNAGNDATICSGASYTLNEAVASGFNTLLWTHNGDGSFNDSSILNPTYTPGEDDLTNGTVTLTLTGSNQDEENTISDEMVLTINALPPLPTGEVKEITYDGAYHSPEASLPDPCENCVLQWYDMDGNTIDSLPQVKNAGTYNFQVATKDTITDCESGTVPVELVITKRTLSLSNFTASDKTYDGNKNAEANFNDDRIEGDVIEFAYTAEFDDKNVGDDKPVNITDITISGGDDKDNYLLVINSGSASSNILPYNLTIEGAVAQNKIYDATNDANVDFTGATLVTPFGGDVVALDITGYGATFDNKNVGTGKAVTVSGVALSGTDADNYTVSQPEGLKADITAVNLTVAGAVAQNKVYDATTTATVNFTEASLDTLFNGDIVTLDTTGYSATFDVKNVGTTIAVTVTGVALSGTDAGNYTVSQPEGLTAEVTPYPITLSTFAAADKTYDGTTPTTITFDDDVIGSDNVSFDYTANFSDRNVNWASSAAQTKTVSYAVSISGGAQADNYMFDVLGTNTGSETSWEGTTTATINQRPITVAVTAGQNKTYGENDPATYAATVSGLDPLLGSGDQISGAVDARVTGENVGDYTIERGSWKIIYPADGNADMEDNYAITFTPADFEIKRLDIALTPTAGQDKIYGESDPLPFIYTTDPAIGTTLDNGIQVALSGTLTRDAGEVVGFYNLLQGNVDNATNPNYNIGFTGNVKFEIERKDIVINVNGNQSKVYGNTDPVYTYTSNPAVGDLPFNAAFIEALVREAGENVASDYTISQGLLELGDDNNAAGSLAQNYNVTFNSADFAITRRPITVTPVANQQKTYGDVNPVYTFTTTTDAIGSTLPNGHVVGLSGALAREGGENAGIYKILQGTVDNTENPNYNVSFTEDVLFTINRLPIAVTANTGQTKIYGQLDPLPFGYTANPAIGHELDNGILVSLSGTLSRESGENVGLYAIQQNTINNITNPNYDVSFNSNNFEITRLDIALTPNAGQKKIYGQADPLPFSYTTVPAIDSELANGIQVALNGTLTRDAGEVVGFYNLLQGNVNNATNPNYNIGFTNNVKFEIERKDIVINVNGNQSKVYGNTDPVYTYTSNPAVGDLPFNAAFIEALVREAGENVASNYTILQGSLELKDDNNGTTSLAQNYNVTFNSADFAITRKAITITVTADQEKVYGETDPVFAFTTEPELASLPFQAASWTGALVRETGEVVGDDYTIKQGSLELIDGQNLSGGSLERNYEVTFTEGDFEITRKPITITVDESIAKTYGDNDPEFTFTSSPELTSLPFNAAWTGNLVRLNTNENVAAYAITEGSLELTDNNNITASLAQNYTVSFVGNNLTINKRDISITVTADQDKVYADTDPVFEYSSSIDPLYYNGVFTGALTRAAGENVADNYAIGRGTLQVVDDNNNATSLDDNYNLNFVPADFEITKKPITITVVDGQNKRYGFDDPTSSPTAPTFFRDFEFVSSVDPLPYGGTFIGALERTGVSSSPVGTYPISRGTLNINDANNTTSLDANYAISFVGSNFTINERLLTLIASDQTKTYGFGPEWDPANPNYWTLGSTEFTVSGTAGDGMAYSETISGVAFTSSGEQRYVDVGTYPIVITPDSEAETGEFLKSNYNISYEDGELEITKKNLTIIMDPINVCLYADYPDISNYLQFNGLVEGDTIDDITANFPAPNSPPGTYPITLTGGSDNNYNYILEDGTLTIHPLPEFEIVGPEKVCRNTLNILYELKSDSNWTYNIFVQNGNFEIESDTIILIQEWLSGNAAQVNITATSTTTGCITEKTKDITFAPNLEAPDAKSIIEKKLTNDQTLLLIYPDSGLTYQWYHNDKPIESATKQYYYPGDNKEFADGKYAVEIAPLNAGEEYICSNFSPPLLISYQKSFAFNEGESFMVYPNPAKDAITILLNDDDVQAGTDLCHLRILDQTGRQLFSHALHEQATQIGLQHLNPGLYLVEVIINNQRRNIKKVIKY